jgi:hypothetical protein
MQQMVDLVVLGGPDRLVEAPGAAGGRNDIPQTDAVRGEPFEAALVAERLQGLADHRAEQAPELVGRVSIITPGCERGVAGQAAENEQATIAARNGGKAEFDAHG